MYDFRIGDKVTPICSRPPDCREPPYWIPDMDILIGKVGVVVSSPFTTYVGVDFAWPNSISNIQYKPSWLVPIIEKPEQQPLSWTEEEVILKKKRDDMLREIFGG